MVTSRSYIKYRLAILEYRGDNRHIRQVRSSSRGMVRENHIILLPGLSQIPDLEPYSILH